MKKFTKFKRLLFGLTTLFTPLLLAAITPGKITFSSGVYGPLTAETNYWDFSGLLRWDKTQATVYESFTITNNSNKDTYTINTNPHFMAANSSHTVEVRLNLFFYVSVMGTHFDIKVINVDNSTIKYSVDFDLYIAGFNSIMMSDYVSKYYSTKPSTFMLNTLTSKVTFYSERIRFDGYVDYINTDSYYRFKFTDFKFTYSYIFPYEDTDGVIYFTDIYNLFPHIKKDRSNRSCIPVITTANGSSIVIELGELYVDPKTLDMSTSQLDGYIPTNYFYFPMRQQEKIKKYSFIGYIFGVGPGNFECGFPLNYIETPSFFGDCIHSDYCVEEELI